jgi:hypothetical protein
MLTFYFLTSIALIGIGAIGSVVVPFTESVSCGLLNLFAPIYPLYYLITRWDAMKRWFVTQLAGLAMLFLGGVLFAGLAPLPGGRNGGEETLLKTIQNDLADERGRAEVGARFEEPQAAATESPQIRPQPLPFDAPQTNAPDDPPQNNPRRNPFRKQPPGAVATANPAEAAPAPSNEPEPAIPADNTLPRLVMDDRAIDQALADLKAPDAPRRRTSLGRLRRAVPVEARRAEVASAIEPLLQEQGQAIRADAARALGVWGGPENTQALVQALNAAEFVVAWAVLDALKAFRDPAAAEAVASRLPEARDRGKAIEALKAMGPGGQASVLKYLDHSDLFVRIEACKILAVIGTTDETRSAITALVNRTKGRGFDGVAANDALRQIGNPR